jgi:hypothetical protein
MSAALLYSVPARVTAPSTSLLACWPSTTHFISFAEYLTQVASAEVGAASR